MPVTRSFDEALRLARDRIESTLAQVTRKGDVADGPRGCALSWSLAFMPVLTPDLARQQYALYRAKWFRHPWGTTGIREWSPGRSGMMDPDSGPVAYEIEPVW